MKFRDGFKNFTQNLILEKVANKVEEEKKKEKVENAGKLEKHRGFVTLSTIKRELRASGIWFAARRIWLTNERPPLAPAPVPTCSPGVVSEASKLSLSSLFITFINWHPSKSRWRRRFHSSHRCCVLYNHIRGGGVSGSVLLVVRVRRVRSYWNFGAEIRRRTSPATRP